MDAASETSTDSRGEMPTDAAAETSTDSLGDIPPDAASETSTDSPGEMPTDAASETSTDGSGEMPTDAAAETSTDSISDAPPLNVTPELCSKMCGVVGQIACPIQPSMSDCVASCIACATTCGPEQAAYYACLVANGAAALMCDDAQMMIVFRDGFCVKEGKAEIDCLTMP
jgi:hypothetical protein